MEGASATSRSTPQLDLALLSGFRFRCRPDCGLCCFTSPRLEGDDERHLRLTMAGVRVTDRGGVRCLAARPHGGACQLLQGLRCSAHGVRPTPCREFPILVHVGTRLQATVVLSCPGLSLEPVRSFWSGTSTLPFLGLDDEVDSVRHRLTPSVERLRTEATRRRRRIVRELAAQGRWVEESEVQDRLQGRRLIPSADEYAPGGLPSADAGLEPLPIYFDGRAGPVALAEREGAWEALEVSPDGVSRSLGVAVPPHVPPALGLEAEELLSGYLRYWLARDGFLAAVLVEMMSIPDGNVLEVALDELQAIGSDVLSRAAFRAQLRGESGARLTSADIELGIRATDQDWLDRPTWGSRL